MKISVICPTYDRPDYHERLYAAFAHQTHEDRELVVLDDSPSASRFFLRCKDPRVSYRYTTTRMSIGAKRNWLVQQAAGDIVAHFDDDDYYAPTYLTSMLALMGDGDFAKRSSWLSFCGRDRSFWRWDTRRVEATWHRVTGLTGVSEAVPTGLGGAALAKFIDETLWGFGFSYFYRRKVSEEVPFPDENHGEDYLFAREVRRRGFAMTHGPDLESTVLHTLHSTSSSLIYPQARVGPEDIATNFGDRVIPWVCGVTETKALP